MMELALIGGALIGLRCRALIVLFGAVLIFAAGFADHVQDDMPLELSAALAFLGAAVAQIAALAVHVLKAGLEGAFPARA